MKINMLMLGIIKKHKSFCNVHAVNEGIVNTVYRINSSGNKLTNDVVFSTFIYLES